MGSPPRHMNLISPMGRKGTYSWASQEHSMTLCWSIWPLMNTAACRISVCFDTLGASFGIYTSQPASLYSRFKTMPCGGFLRSTTRSVLGHDTCTPPEINCRVLLKATLAPWFAQPCGLGNTGNFFSSARNASRSLLPIDVLTLKGALRGLLMPQVHK